MSWRPIESAPKDGTRIIVASAVNVWCDVAWTIRPRAGARWEHLTLGAIRFEPTHWMPLPDPPGAEVPPDAPRFQCGCTLDLKYVRCPRHYSRLAATSSAPAVGFLSHLPRCECDIPPGGGCNYPYCKSDESSGRTVADCVARFSGGENFKGFDGPHSNSVDSPAAADPEPPHDPTWKCSTCSQVNAAWAEYCGRCDERRTDKPGAPS